MNALRLLLQPIIVPIRKWRQRRERDALRRAGKELNINPTIRVKKTCYGAGDGEWTIANCNPKVVYSFGVGKDIRFEVDLLKHFDTEVHSFDPTPRAIQWITQQKLPSGLTFHPWGIANYDGMADFSLPEGHAVSYVMGETMDKNKHGGIVKKLSTIMSELGHSQIDILKMDIEGAEYDVIKDIAKSNLHINQILVEFHHRFLYINLEQTENAIRLLQSIGYELFDVSARGLEYGFVKKSV
ncbi:FkbM family methyltransferase [Patescibacteria group bacterium]|nr:FkbM family methyltransferase [Patescibacteria group bacterium]